MSVDLTLQEATDGTGNKDTLSSIENIIGSNHNDTLTGSTGSNVIIGGGGDDTLDGGGGVDVYRFDEVWGDDSIVDAAGTKTLDFTNVSANLTFLLHADGTVSVADGTDPMTLLSFIPGASTLLTDDVNTLTNVENVELLIAGKGDNTFIFEDGAVFAGIINGGTGTNNTLDYSLYTTPVAVSLTLGSATGTLGISGIQSVKKGIGDFDLFSSGGSSDTASYLSSASGVQVDLSIIGAQNTGASTDDLTGVDNLTGSNFNDLLTGNANNNILNGAGGNDTLTGGLGSDTYLFEDAWGVDTVVDESGPGSTLDFSAVLADLTFTVHQDGSVSVTDGTSYLSLVKNVTKLIGGSGDNSFEFEDGALFAGVIDGGSGGVSTLDLTAYQAGVQVRLAAGTATLRANTSVKLVTSFSSIANIIGGAGADDLVGDGEANILDGGAGSDALDGGGGVDTVSYEDSPGAVNVNLSLGTASDGYGNTDSITGIENIDGSAFDDTLRGNSSDNMISGGAGDDFIIGGGGTDTVNYESDPAGVDVDLALGTATDGYGDTDSLLEIDNVDGSSFNDTLTGNAANNQLSGIYGNDILDGGAGDDTLIGGEGTDTASYSSVTGGVEVDLAITDAQDTIGAGTDTITEVENLTGSAGNDILKGDSKQNGLSGGGGTDSLAGLDGADTYIFVQGEWGAETTSEEKADADSPDISDRFDFSRVTADLTFTIHTDGTVSVTDGTRFYK